MSWGAEFPLLLDMTCLRRHKAILDTGDNPAIYFMSGSGKRRPLIELPTGHLALQVVPAPMNFLGTGSSIRRAFPQSEDSNLVDVSHVGSLCRNQKAQMSHHYCWTSQDSSKKVRFGKVETREIENRFDKAPPDEIYKRLGRYRDALDPGLRLLYDGYTRKR